MGPDVFLGAAGRCRSLVTKNRKPNSDTGELWSEDVTSVLSLVLRKPSVFVIGIIKEDSVCYSMYVIQSTRDDYCYVYAVYWLLNK